VVSTDVVYLYGHGRRKHIAAHPSVRPLLPALCGWSYYTEQGFLDGFSSRADRDAITERLRRLPVCAHCERAKASTS
jgi:hypothetical protein